MMNNKLHKCIVKAVIKDVGGKVALVKESSDTWDLPGGGIEHGETVREALARELNEEISLGSEFEATLLGVETIQGTKADTYYMFVIYSVIAPNEYQLKPGQHSQAAQYFDPFDFKNEDDRSSQFIYKYGAGDFGKTIDYSI